MKILEVLGESAFFFVVLGLPFLSRYMPYIRGKDDVSDPTTDSMRNTQQSKEEAKARTALLLKRTVQVYAIILIFFILLNILL